MGKKETLQIELDFTTKSWPPHLHFPLNLPTEQRNVQSILDQDLNASQTYAIITGFTSLSHLIDTFGAHDHPALKTAKILLGWEPLSRGRKHYERHDLPTEVKNYWVKEGLSIMQGGAVMALLEKIKSGLVAFRYQNKTHAKIYVGDLHAVLGSSNYSKSGLNDQQEANIRVDRQNETSQYDAIKLIADNFYDAALPYDGIVKLLEQLIKCVSWQEALARAIAEMMEGEWLAEYRNILSQLEQTKLWPTQHKGVAQAITILQRQSSVLIADPTGAGKTKLCAAVILSLQHWLYEIGNYHKTESLIVCPPLVTGKWTREFEAFRKFSPQARSMGLLSTKQKELATMLGLSHILTIDEAHNYLTPESNRTISVKDNHADYKILITATPISRKVEDLLRLIELLDVDNLSDVDFVTYRMLLGKRKTTEESDRAMLRNFISQFTLRRTKKYLNAEIDKNPEDYKNKLNVVSRFPEHVEKIYKTGETLADIKIAEEINELCQQLKGVTYLLEFKVPSYEMSEEKLETYIKRRVIAARGLSVYMVRAAMRSSAAAVVEHVEGTAAARRIYDLKAAKKDSGNKLERLRGITERDKLPKKAKVFPDSYFPEWLTDKALYFRACEDELRLYQKISELAQTFSNGREVGKVHALAKAAKTHKGVLAFDSTVITIQYLHKLFNEHYPHLCVRAATGSDKAGDTAKVIEELSLGYDAKHQCIALCSDMMAESVDLQRASCLFLLDMPSVVRIVEQRIGRVDRMDSMNPSIDIYWPDDSEVFSLKADARLIETNEHVEQVLGGSNFNVPQMLKGRHFTKTGSVQDMQTELREFVDKDESWKGIQDSFQCINDLKEGATAIVPEEIYEMYRDVSGDVRTRVSFLRCDSEWCFLALRGYGNKSPRWYFINGKGKVFTDNQAVCEQLREHVSEGARNLEWNDVVLSKFISLFKKEERHLLPPKKMRALRTAAAILEKKNKKKPDIVTKTAYDRMLAVLDGSAPEVVDYERLAEEWISVLQPYMKQIRSELKRKKDVVNYDALKTKWREIEITAELIHKIIDHSEIADEIDKRIASCIIGVDDVGGIEVEFDEVIN